MIYIALSLALAPLIFFMATPDGNMKLAACFYISETSLKEYKIYPPMSSKLFISWFIMLAYDNPNTVKFSMMGTLSPIWVILEAGLTKISLFYSFSYSIVFFVIILDILLENCLKFYTRSSSNSFCSLLSPKHLGQILPLILLLRSFLTLIFYISSCFSRLILRLRSYS